METKNITLFVCSTCGKLSLDKDETLRCEESHNQCFHLNVEYQGEFKKDRKSRDMIEIVGICADCRTPIAPVLIVSLEKVFKTFMED